MKNPKTTGCALIAAFALFLSHSVNPTLSAIGTAVSAVFVAVTGAVSKDHNK